MKRTVVFVGIKIATILVSRWAVFLESRNSSDLCLDDGR